MVKNPPVSAGDMGLNPGLRRFPCRREWQLTPAFLPRKSHGQKILVGYSPWGHKESDMIEQLNNNNHEKNKPHGLPSNAKPQEN